jgi:hypothetical protein
MHAITKTCMHKHDTHTRSHRLWTHRRTRTRKHTNKTKALMCVQVHACTHAQTQTDRHMHNALEHHTQTPPHTHTHASRLTCTHRHKDPHTLAQSCTSAHRQIDTHPDTETRHTRADASMAQRVLLSICLAAMSCEACVQPLASINGCGTVPQRLCVRPGHGQMANEIGVRTS